MGNLQEKYTEHLTVESAEVDGSSRLKLYSFLCKAQEIANRHATSLGFGYNQLIKNHSAWVLSRIKAEVLRSPLWQEEMIMQTWHKGLSGPFSIRDFEILSSDGSSVWMRCTSSWLILDLDSRKMLRTDHVLGSRAEETALHVDSISTPCPKIPSSKELTFVSERKISYSDVDFNLHSNNAKYMEWALDCLDPQLLLSREIDEFQLNINHETHIGDTVSFYVAPLSESEFYIEGKILETNIFQILLKLKP